MHDAGPPVIGVPIVDSHHHLMDRAAPMIARALGGSRYLIDEYLHFIGTAAETVVATVAVEVRTMYRANGPDAYRAVGEVEFLNGQAAMAASGLYGSTRVAAGIIGFADLALGDDARGVLEASCAAAPQRLKSIRQDGIWDADPDVTRGIFTGPQHLYRSDAFRRGFAHLAPLSLAFDAFVLGTQLDDVVDLAHRFPETSIVLDHLGHSPGIGVHAGRHAESFAQWRRAIEPLVDCANVTVKLGGLGTFLAGSPYFRSTPPAPAEALVAEWRPYVETTLELFGADRCMFESNAPTDGCASFDTLCRVYATLTAGCSIEERRAIFAGTATRVYRLDYPGADAG